MTYLAVPISASTMDAAVQAMRRAEAGGAELLELRLDLLPGGAAGKLPPLAKVPVLATCRDRAEGGAATGDDATRAGVLAAAIAAGAALVDFEFAAWERSAEARRILSKAMKNTGGQAASGTHPIAPSPRGEGRGEGSSAGTTASGARPSDAKFTLNGKPDAKLVLSSHVFAGRVDDVGQLLEKLWASPADIIKIAYTASRITDCFDALDALHAARHHKPTIALAMGEAGVMTRLLAKKLGAFCTFAALESDQATAPGQPTLAQFKTLYRWDRVGPASELFGVIGHPIAHSMSPAIHNTAFDAGCPPGYDGLYLPLLVEPGPAAFNELVDGIVARNGWLNFRGLSVTLPHKESALRYVLAAGGEVDELSGRIGAINTIRFDGEALLPLQRTLAQKHVAQPPSAVTRPPKAGEIGPGAGRSTPEAGVPHSRCAARLSGRNTDYAAAFDSVCAALGCGCQRTGLRGPSVAVLGAGGVARAIVAGFTDAGAKVTIYNRTLERAEQLAAEFGCRARPFADRARNDAQIIINATSIGMSPNVDESPLPSNAIGAGQLVFDTIYNPIRTRLIAEAEQRGAITVTGVEMFVRQAVAQFEWWTGRPAPVEVMRKVVLERLGGKIR